MNDIDQRKHRRLRVPRNTIVYTNDSFGQIENISSGGFSLKYIDMETPVHKDETVDIILGDIAIEQIPVTVVWQNRTEPADKDSIIMSLVGFKFARLSDQQRAMLDFYISSSGSKSGNA